MICSCSWYNLIIIIFYLESITYLGYKWYVYRVNKIGIIVKLRTIFMLDSWLTLVPPALVIITTFLTHHIHLSLTVGIIAASIVAAHGALFKSFVIGCTALWD